MKLVRGVMSAVVGIEMELEMKREWCERGWFGGTNQGCLLQ